jgi:hypothetical protein
MMKRRTPKRAIAILRPAFHRETKKQSLVRKSSTYMRDFSGAFLALVMSDAARRIIVTARASSKEQYLESPVSNPLWC